MNPYSFLKKDGAFLLCIILGIISLCMFETNQVFLDAKLSQLLNGYFLLKEHHGPSFYLVILT